MRERLQGFWEAVKALWERLSRIARIVLLCSIVGIIGIIIILTVLLNQKNYVLLNNDFSTVERAKATAVLSEQNIDYILEPNGSIMVLDSDLNRARMQIATAGLPGGVFDESYTPGLTATQQDKNYLQKTELQKRLQVIIETFDEIDRAAVTISMPEKNAFALQTDVTPPSANIMLVKRQGRTLSSEQILGILNIVKDSVAGLTEENISITDETGDLQSMVALGMDVNNAKLRLTEEVNTTTKNRALSLLRPMFGVGNVVVEVSSVLDTDTRSGQVVTYNPLDPENPERNPLDYGEHNRDLVGDGLDVVQGVPGANDNVGTPQYGAEQAAMPNATNYSVHDIYDYLVGYTKEDIEKNGLTITDATASVLINARTLADGQRDQITALVSNATGIAVEKITVLNYEFAAGPDVPEDTVTSRLTTSQILGLVALGLLVLTILIVTIIVIITKRRKRLAEEAAAAAALLEEENALEDAEDIEPINVVETTEQKLRSQIKDLATSDPEIVASLLKSWLTAGS